MGIEKLNPFLKEHCPEAFVEIPYSYFRGKRIAIDSDNVLRKLMSRAHKEVVNHTDVCVHEPDRKQIVDTWKYHVKEDLLRFLNIGIIPVYVFDGKYIDEKSETQLKRRAEKKKRVDEAAKMKEEILKLDELERTAEMVTNLRKKMHHLSTITPEDKTMIQNYLRSLGIPVLNATEEGEKLCGMLCIEGKVEAVMSTDTDLIAMGCPMLIAGDNVYVTNLKTGERELGVICTLFKPILNALKMEYSTFLDLCIMSGCDFNSNIPQVGIGRAYKQLLTCKSIENLDKKYDEKKKILNHIKCREIFKIVSSKDVCQDDIDLNLSQSDVKFEDETDELILNAINCLPKIEDFCVERKPSLASSQIRLKIIPSAKKDLNKSQGDLSIIGGANYLVPEGKIVMSENIPQQGVIKLAAHSSPEKLKPGTTDQLAKAQLLKFKLNKAQKDSSIIS